MDDLLVNIDAVETIKLVLNVFLTVVCVVVIGFAFMRGR